MNVISEPSFFLIAITDDLGTEFPPSGKLLFPFAWMLNTYKYCLTILTPSNTSNFTFLGPTKIFFISPVSCSGY